MIEASLVFTLVFHEHQVLLKVNCLCLFLKFPATRQLEGLVPEVRKVLTLRLVMSVASTIWRRKIGKLSYLILPLAFSEVGRHEMTTLSWSGHSDTSTEVRVVLEIQAHCREQIRGMTYWGWDPFWFYFIITLEKCTVHNLLRSDLFFLRNDSGRNRWAGNGAGTSQPPNHIIPPEANCKWPNSHTPNPHSPLHSWFLTNKLPHSQIHRKLAHCTFFPPATSQNKVVLAVTLHFQLVAMALATV